MDPVTAAGLALGVAGVALQVYTTAIQGIQLLITAADLPEHCKYLNLRLRMEQQRLFAWSETSGLMDLDASNRDKILASNTFVLHRTTVLDLLVQVQCLFDEFRRHAERNQRLRPTFPDAGQGQGQGQGQGLGLGQEGLGQEDLVDTPEKDAAAAHFPLPPRRRDFIRKAMRKLREKSREGVIRLRWVSFDKDDFETLLAKFSTLNDNMTDILDARMQKEIHHTVQDTNRGVLQLHHRISDLSRLVQALNVKLELGGMPSGAAAAAATPLSLVQKATNASGLQLLSQLAKFKAFNESMESERKTAWDEATAMSLGLGEPNEQRSLQLDRTMIILDPSVEVIDAPRCEALLKLPGGQTKRCWIEWREYERQRPGDASPPKGVIIERVGKLAALLNHSPKPDAFRTPHCLGFFDKAHSTAEEGQDDDEDDEILNHRLGLVFERPQDESLDTSLPPVSLGELLKTVRKPRVTERIKLAHAVAHCLLYLHAVNWLHKGLRSQNIVFFRTEKGHINYDKPLLSGFDFSRPARPDEMTDIPGGEDLEYDLYRHPRAQSSLSTCAEERERFRRSFDIYSLGVLFVEIAYWRTVDQVVGIDMGAARVSPRAALGVRSQLLAEEVMQEVGASVGEVFEGAARRCIAGGTELGLAENDDETSDVVAAKLSMAFYEDVVKKLGDIRV